MSDLAQRVTRFQSLTTVVRALLTLLGVVIAVVLVVAVSPWLGLAMLLVGTPLLRWAVAPLLVWPLGYLLCGREATRYWFATVRNVRR